MTESGDSPDEIVSGYPHLSLSSVYAALAFYHDNQDLIDRQIRESADLVAEFKDIEPKDNPGTASDSISP